ncbi:hypothetical protein M5E06_21005 [Azospirillum sp. A1-3]|uniref:DnaA N-terminal domain-containing protein n=1 Tax=Azospirillum sp. A1-3 TaxID=185874 RepID=UPI002076E8B1|nr:DnaA N-terminal domain-containing protein [Azospirillum sp. A1-3]MCM8736609.1 hypothetical protein [Azospirillum sp. A1-3]
MARIRSTFPGQWTDEDFVECQPLARLLAISLRNEADDQGVFEWKPIGLKMRLLPADNVDINTLLADLEAHQQVKRFTVDGKAYGAIRNFVKYQKPKKPTKVHPLPSSLRDWVRMDLWSTTKKKTGAELDADQHDDAAEQDEADDTAGSELPTASNAPSSELARVEASPGSEPKRVQRTAVPKSSEMAAQREEGGGKREEEEGTRVVESSAGGRPYACAHEAGRPADGLDDGISAVRQGVADGFERWFDLPGRPISPADGELFAEWIAAGAERGLSPADTAAAVVEEVQRQFRQLDAKHAGPPRSLSAVLDRDVRTAIANARPGSKRKPLPEVPEPYAGHFDAVTYANWIAPCQISVADGTATLLAPSAYHRDWVAQQLADRLKAVLVVEDLVITVAKGQGRNAA